jgi:hypothetical protein
VELLAIYLQDHLAASTAGLELVKRAHGANRRSEFGAPLAALRDDIAADRATLLEVMRRLDVGRDRVKETVGWAAEKAGRLKLNGRLLGYSPLSRVVELEGLAMAITGKRKLWELLDRPPVDRRLDGVDVPRMLARADDQLARVTQLHARATVLAFTSTPA